MKAYKTATELPMEIKCSALWSWLTTCKTVLRQTLDSAEELSSIDLELRSFKLALTPWLRLSNDLLFVLHKTPLKVC